MVASTSAMKLLAAGCVVGLLSGVSVRAEADGVVPGEEMPEDPAEMPMDGEEMPEEEPMDGEPEDVFAAEEEPVDGEPEEPVEEEPVEEEPVEEDPLAEPVEEDPLADPLAEPVEDEPVEEEPVEEEPVEEEPVDAMAPMADGETAPEPDPEVLKMLGYDIVQGVDYLGAPDVAMSVVENAEECAEECDTDPGCNLAAYYVAEFPAGFNCWLKALDPGCTVPADTQPAPNAWLMVSDNKCDVAAAPGAAPLPAGGAVGTYQRYPGMDYIPADAIPGSAAKTITVMDLGTGSLVDTVADCEAECDATPTCNAAAYLATVLADTGKNCYLKVLGTDDCEIPADADDVPDATLSIKCEDALAPLAAAAAPTGVLAPAAGPAGAEFASPPTSDDVGTRGLPGDTAGDTEAGDGDAAVADSSNVAALATSVAAVAVAGAIALL